MLHKSCITALTATAFAALLAFHGRASAEEADGDLVIAARGPTGFVNFRVDLDQAGKGTVADTRFALGTISPGPPGLKLRFRVTAANPATAAAGAALVSVGAAAGIDANTVVSLLSQANIGIAVASVTPGPPGNGALSPAQISHLIDLLDGGLFSVGPGGGCEVFKAGLVALGLPQP